MRSSNRLAVTASIALVLLRVPLGGAVRQDIEQFLLRVAKFCRPTSLRWSRGRSLRESRPAQSKRSW